MMILQLTSIAFKAVYDSIPPPADCQDDYF